MIIEAWGFLYHHVDPIYALSLAVIALIFAVAFIGWWFSSTRKVGGAISIMAIAMLWAFRKGEKSQAARDSHHQEWRWPWQ